MRIAGVVVCALLITGVTELLHAQIRPSRRPIPVEGYSSSIADTSLAQLGPSYFIFGAGLGLLDGLHLNFGIGRGQKFLRFMYGKLETGTTTFSPDFHYHVSGRSKYTAIKPWYVGAGYLSIFEVYVDKTDYYGLLKLYAGRDFNVSERSVIQFELGLGLLAFAPEMSQLIDVDTKAIPIFNLKWIWRIGVFFTD